MVDKASTITFVVIYLALFVYVNVLHTPHALSYMILLSIVGVLNALAVGFGLVKVRASRQLLGMIFLLSFTGVLVWC